MLKVLKAESESRKGVKPGSMGGSLFWRRNISKMNINRLDIEVKTGTGVNSGLFLYDYQKCIVIATVKFKYYPWVAG